MLRRLSYMLLSVLAFGALGAVIAPAPPLPAVSAGPTHVERASAGDSANPDARDTASRRPSADAVSTERTIAYLRSRHTGLSEREIRPLAELITREARRHDLEPELVVGVIRVESSGYNFAVSHVGALGLMQLMPATGAELARKHGVPWHGPSTLFNPEINVKLGTAYLRQLANRYGGSVDTALAAYNWGPGRIDRRLRKGSKLPTRYMHEVLKAKADTQTQTRDSDSAKRAKPRTMRS